ncbi:hypothetical protein FOBRF1_013467 [Fusarium oxysporum]
MTAVCFNICNSWAGISASLQIALLHEPATLLYGLYVSSSLNMGIALNMAELASVYPIAGGQYHFASILASKRINRSLSYVCALLTMLSWVSIGSAILMIPSAQILAFVQYRRPKFVQKPWHYFLIYEAVGLIPLALKKLPRTHDRLSDTYLPKDLAFRLPSVLGSVVNVWVVGLATVLSTFFLLPPFLPVTAGTMNYICVILGIAALLGVLNWMLYARKHYQGPRIVLKD